ncbi:MAG: thioesterase family protein [Chitinophagales bacterium]
MTEIPIRGYHLDFYQHVNNARYLEFLEESRWNYFSETINSEYFETRGWGFVIVNININFRMPAVLGDIVQIECTIKKIGSRSITIYQKITEKNSGKFVGDADVTFVVLDIKENKAVKINEDLKQMFEKA